MRHERYLGFVSDAPRASVDVAPGGPATISSSDMMCIDAIKLSVMVRKVEAADRWTATQRPRRRWRFAVIYTAKTFSRVECPFLVRQSHVALLDIGI